MTKQEQLRNIAIIAHVDHGKTTLVDQLFKQSGMFRENQDVDERLMDSSDLERERGITITSKNGGFDYKGYRINVIDTPGHADFGGQVERVLTMADAAVLLVDAAEGPMPQTYFVLKKALAQDLPIIVVVNKIDKPAARCDWVVDQVFDLLVQLDAPDHIIDFPIIYASAKDGIAKRELDDDSTSLEPLFDTILSVVPHPTGDVNGPVQLLVSSISYSPFLGRLAIGKLTSGTLSANDPVSVYNGDETLGDSRITKIYTFSANQQVEAKGAIAGDIIAVGGIEDITVGHTITDTDNPLPLPAVAVDPPTISMNFLPNSSPFSGKEGEYVTSNNLKDRLYKERLSDVALHVEERGEGLGFKVSGRGELHLSILIEKMRREGYEFEVSRPQVIFKENDDGQKQEPYEELFIEVSEENQGKVIEALGSRKGELADMHVTNGLAKLKYKIPTRGLLGFKSEFMTLTKGLGIMNYVFAEYGPFVGEMRNRKNGVLIVKDQCATVAFALKNLQERGTLFLGPGVDVYGGQIIGENARTDDMVVNAGKSKKLTNMRASGSDEQIALTPPRKMSLEDYIAFINDDELVEVTPKNIRLRKRK